MTTVSDATTAVLPRHTAAWQVGTGVRVALSPGDYYVVGRIELGGRAYLELEGGVVIDAADRVNPAE